MPKKKYNLPKGLQNKPVGSENWYQMFYKKDRSPKIKWVRLNAHELMGAKIERERLIRAFELGLFDPWEEKKSQETRTDPQLAEAIEQYLKAKAGLAKNTRRNHRATLRLFLTTTTRRRRLSQITEKDVERFVMANQWKASTLRERLANLAGFFSWCIDEGLAESNPARDYLHRRRRSMSAFERRQFKSGAERGAVMPADLRALLSVAGLSRHHSYLYDVMLFAVATGLRRDELCHLCRRDVELDPPPTGFEHPVTGRLRVRCYTNPKTGERFTTKNGRDRLLPMTPLAARIAARHLEAHVTEDPYAPVFRTGARGTRLAKDQLSKRFKSFRVEAGLPDSITFHSLRHSHASYLMMLGVNVLTIKRLLGHSTLAQLDTYAELCEEYLLGDARPLQREILVLFCPDLPDAVVDRILPSRQSLLRALSGQSVSRIQSLQAVIPMEDVLFSGLVYQATVVPAEVST